jgi:long-chain fatty acid transport protein
MRNAKLILVAGVVLLAPALVFGNGFALFEHGARGVAMGGAFCAVADDATTNYYNPAGLAFLEGSQVAAGAYLITEQSKFAGMNYPYPGADYRAQMENQIFYPFHIHLTGHLSKSIGWGVSIYNPFGLGTWWADDFAGRYISKRIDLKVFNINPNIAIKLSEKVSFSLGIDYFLSSVDLTKSIGAINPYTQKIVDIAQVHMYNKLDDGVGFNLGFLAKPSDWFSVGASYRSRVKVKYDAEASFVQIPTGTDFDAIVAGLLPFATNPKGQTEINFPAEYRLGFAFRTGKMIISLDGVLMDWDSFQNLPLTIVGYPQLSSVRVEDYKDAYQVRVGFDYRISKRWSWLWGALYDETPVPDISVSPLLPDASRWGLSAGFSYDMTERVRLDVGYLYLRFEDRSTRGVDQDNFNGWYRTIANLLGFTISYRF